MSKTTFPRLDTLEAVIAATSNAAIKSLPGIALVCCQHLLETTGSLIECLVRNGVRADRVFLVGKVYSTNAGVAAALRDMGCEIIEGSDAQGPGRHDEAIRRDADQMWDRAAKAMRGEMRKVIVLDDGAHMSGSIPVFAKDYCRPGSLIGVEQTTSGLGRKRTAFPVVNVASSAVKRLIEPSLVCRAVVERARRLAELHSDRTKCGVIGLGKVGGTLAVALRRSGYRVFGFDIDEQRYDCLLPAERSASVEQLIASADVVFGCTGRDSVPPKSSFTGRRGTKIFVSCSSSDDEFRSILRQRWSWTNQKGDVARCPTLVCQYPKSQLCLQVLRSGYPVNFDNSPESVPRDDIQLTRGLLLGGILQASELLSREYVVEARTIKLDPTVQRIVYRAWHGKSDIPEGLDISWYEHESRGNLLPCAAFTR